MLEESEQKIEEARELQKAKKDKMLKKYVEGRDSMDMGGKFQWNEESQKENFSLFAFNKQTSIERGNLKHTNNVVEINTCDNKNTN